MHFMKLNELWLQLKSSRFIQILSIVVFVELFIIISLVNSPVSDEQPTVLEEPENNSITTEWLGWQEDNVVLKDGKADVYFVHLAQEQKIEMYFNLNPSDAEISVVIGVISGPPNTNWRWSYRVTEYGQIQNYARFVFSSESSNYYGIKLKPRLDITVDVGLKYRVST